MDKGKDIKAFISRNRIEIFILLFLLLYFTLSFTKQINLTNSDIGRHIKNGEIFIKENKLLSTNFYSYTNTDFETINHHWLSGVVFYLVYSLFNFPGLSIFFTFIYMVALGLLFYTAKKKSNLLIASFITLLAIPLLNTRNEIRPEGFSYLFIALYIYLIHKVESKSISEPLFLTLILITQVLWVNMHIYFIFGLFILGVYLIKNILGKSNPRFLTLTILLSALACFASPWGLKGVLEPFNIFKDYGYMLAENQSVFFMQRRSFSFIYIYLEIISLFSFFLIFVLWRLKKYRKLISEIIVQIVFLILAFKFIRSIPLVGISSILFASSSLITIQRISKKSLDKIIISIAATIFTFFTLIPNQNFSLINQNFGFGLINGSDSSARFLIDNEIDGPIFNNYDIGGYLIYYLYPEKVFVDNRPEAYPSSFFEEIYVPMQEDESIWEEKPAEYDFNVIFFYRHDMTPWAQPFLIERIKDSKWVPVFVDNFCIILVRNNEKNEGTIKKYKLPISIFQLD